jgi:hypothetical protein
MPWGLKRYYGTGPFAKYPSNRLGTLSFLCFRRKAEPPATHIACHLKKASPNRMNNPAKLTSHLNRIAIRQILAFRMGVQQRVLGPFAESDSGCCSR